MMSPKLAAADGRIALSLHDMLGPDHMLPKTPPSEEELGAGPKKSFQPYHAQSVPKPQNLTDHAFDHSTSGKPVTTMMLRNIPNKYTQTSLLQEIDDLVFAGTYNFFYLPMDVHNRSNVGYAFINFSAPADAERFRSIFSEHRFQRFQSRKISSVCAAHVQGLDENLLHFDNKAVTHARNDQYRPIVLWNNQRMEFEDAVAAAKIRLSGVQPPQPRARVGSWCGAPAPRATPVAATPAGIAPTAAPVTAGPRLGLENAIRDMMQARLSPSLGPADAPTLPMDPQFHTPLGFQQAPAAPPPNKDDIIQLLSLRSMLVDRLHEEPSVRQKRAAAMPAPWQGPAYVPLPGSKTMPKSGQNNLLEYNNTRKLSDDWAKAGTGSTPRENSMYLGSMLDKFVPERAWCAA